MTPRLFDTQESSNSCFRRLFTAAFGYGFVWYMRYNRPHSCPHISGPVYSKTEFAQSNRTAKENPPPKKSGGSFYVVL